MKILKGKLIFTKMEKRNQIYMLANYLLGNSRRREDLKL